MINIYRFKTLYTIFKFDIIVLILQSLNGQSQCNIEVTNKYLSHSFLISNSANLVRKKSFKRGNFVYKSINTIVEETYAISDCN